MQPIDPQKVQNKLNELNEEGKPGAPNWVSPEGMTAIISVATSGSNFVFNPNSGVPLKIFVNSQTGEIKVFDARAFVVTE